MFGETHVDKQANLLQHVSILLNMMLTYLAAGKYRIKLQNLLPMNLAHVAEI